MKLKELLNTCMNSWIKNGFEKNPLWTATIYFENKSDNLLEEDYKLKANYCDDENYLMKYRNREVRYWKAEGLNDILIEIEGSY